MLCWGKITITGRVGLLKGWPRFSLHEKWRKCFADFCCLLPFIQQLLTYKITKILISVYWTHVKSYTIESGRQKHIWVCGKILRGDHNWVILSELSQFNSSCWAVWIHLIHLSPFKSSSKVDSSKLLCRVNRSKLSSLVSPSESPSLSNMSESSSGVNLSELPSQLNPSESPSKINPSEPLD